MRLAALACILFAATPAAGDSPWSLAVSRDGIDVYVRSTSGSVTLKFVNQDHHRPARVTYQASCSRRTRRTWETRSTSSEASVRLNPGGETHEVWAVGGDEVDAVRVAVFKVDRPVEESRREDRSGHHGEHGRGAARRLEPPASAPRGCNPLHQCLEVLDVVRGKDCGNPRSIIVKYRNACDRSVQVTTCFPRVDKPKWECGQEDLKPGRKSETWRCEADQFRIAVYAKDDPYSCSQAEQDSWGRP